MDKQKEKITYVMIDYPHNETHEYDEKHQGSPGDEIHGEDRRIIIQSIGTEDTKAIMVPEGIRLHIKFETNQRPHVIFQYILGFVSVLVTEDPTKVHRDIIRATLNQINPELLNDKSIEDMMARALIEQCRKLKLKLKAPKYFQEPLNNTKKNNAEYTVESGQVTSDLNIIELDVPVELEEAFEKDGMFIWDKALLDALKSTGKCGKNSAIECEEPFRNRLKLFKLEEKSPLTFWFNVDGPTPEKPFHISPALQLLTTCIYDDIVKKTISFRDKYPPVLANTIHNSVNIIHRGEIIITDDQIQIFNDGSLVGSRPIATIDQKVLTHVFRGVAKYRTVTGHRLLRFLPQKAINQLVNGIDSFHVLEYSGGFAQIAEELGLKGKKANSDIKDLLYGLAFIEWNFPDFTANLLTLSQYKSEVTRNQNKGVKIGLGPELSPYYASKHKELLTPIAKDPQLVGPPRYYSHQYSLQNEIMAEFSNQSVRLVDDGIIIMEDNVWELGGLPTKIRERVKECWVQDTDEGERFLEKIDKNSYTLGPSYHKELKFLKDQGEYRKQRSRDALLAIENRKNKNK